ncbi:MAG: biotin/lipoyl-containing protein [Candidatus Zeuxoniibacter abyssi]|nr:MAG: biotin/lipoyl-containing protein [Candidatus Persebacteraceae bacterium AB1(2)]
MTTQVRTQTAGNMWKIMVKPGDKVKAGDTLFIMEVMKMEVNHVAPEDGEVKAVHAEEGQEGLDADMVVVDIE